MSEQQSPKLGDRVRVEYEALYHGRDPRNGVHVVGFIGDDRYEVDAPATAKLTVLSKKPLRVGDKVWLGVDPEPPLRTVLLFPNGVTIKRLTHQQGWTYASVNPDTYDWRDIPGSVATIVWLPEAGA